MFGNNTKKDVKSNTLPSMPSPSGHSLNSVVEGTIIEGDIRTESDIRIDGNLSGTLNCKGRVIIGPKGVVEGDIRCENALIEGAFHGLLSCNDTLTVNETASITGDINTDKLVVHSGATFNVNCNMGVKNATKNHAEKKQEIKLTPGATDKKPAKDEIISFVEDPIKK
ncbi:MAG: polymer-forming cytoskeletal protein [Saprospiraceae bacterium]|nr:polymer-forming cytoskeletal protein [Saprospiraceae bacterium]MCB9322029.1 polymer-forming cytoskeletal protein [Lewinellaceae bacterium]